MHLAPIAEGSVLTKAYGAVGLDGLLTGMRRCRLPDTKVGVLLLEAPRCTPGVHRMVKQSGFPVLPPLSNRRGSTCMWSTLFKSTRVPRAMVVQSSTGSILCRDAIHAIHRTDSAKFPWQPSSWSSALVGAVLSACSSTTRAPQPSRSAVCCCCTAFWSQLVHV